MFNDLIKRTLASQQRYLSLLMSDGAVLIKDELIFDEAFSYASFNRKPKYFGFSLWFRTRRWSGDAVSLIVKYTLRNSDLEPLVFDKDIGTHDEIMLKVTPRIWNSFRRMVLTNPRTIETEQVYDNAVVNKAYQFDVKNLIVPNVIDDKPVSVILDSYSLDMVPEEFRELSKNLGHKQYYGPVHNEFQGGTFESIYEVLNTIRLGYEWLPYRKLEKICRYGDITATPLFWWNCIFGSPGTFLIDLEEA